ncbi:glycoside hydrolase family 16 protein [Aeromicrobium sp. Root495]|uniref:glycoside hydrolase family 16 protein n=1 Tax=Aeromicrobium sp. Root495 TaxID=1736550 RepID=UPI0012E91265|nr:glycoside hydrolase family 16 protein [Aeromicrobium sp. Root495]
MNRLTQAALMSLCGLVAATACAGPSLTPGAQTGPDVGAVLRSEVSEPLQGEELDLTGSTGTSGRRTVELQRFTSGSWTSAVAKVRSSASGRFQFSALRVDQDQVYRARTAGSSPIVTNALKLEVQPARQDAAVKTMPLLAGRATEATGDVKRGLGLVQAGFEPARRGRTVEFEARGDDGTWRSMGRTAQDENGRAALITKDPQQYDRWRVTTAAYHGLPEATAEKAPVRWKETFESDFTESGSSDQWKNRLVRTWLPDRTCSFISADQVSYPGGVATLSTEALSKEPRGMEGTAPGNQVHEQLCTDATDQARYYASSMIVSQKDGQLYSFVHGVAAARIKFDPKAGQHAAFWLQTNQDQDTEVDVVESYGRGVRPLSSGLHVTQKDGTTRPFQIRLHEVLPPDIDDDWYTKFHTFSVEWTPRQLVFRVDGIETFRTSRGATSSPHFVLLSNFAADYEVRYNTGERASMEVDWVRVWQEPDDVPAEEGPATTEDEPDLVAPPS